MADILQALQSAGAPDQGVDISAAIGSVGQPAPQAASAPAPSAGDHAGQGFMDTFYGLGRLAQHVVPDSALNLLRRGAGAAFNAVGATDIGSSFTPQSTAQFDSMVSQREQQYQQARAQNGQTGIDWWRLGGNAANPVNYLGAGGGAAPTVLGRIGSAAAQGAGMGAVQASAESTDPNGYWGDVTKGGATGAAAGGAVGGIAEGVTAGLRAGLQKARQVLAGNSGATSTQAADAVVKNTLQAQGVDPASVNLNLLSGMRSEVQSALDHGADISPEAIVNRARAESLPVPVNMTRGQATGDAMQFAREQNMRGIEGVGEPITGRLTEQNQAFIQNLDALGAKNAPDPVSTGTQYASKIQSFWDQLQQNKNNLYAQVRNSQGQSAAMDGVGAAQNIKAALDSPQASHVYDLLPANIKKTIESLNYGELPLTVAQSQSLDKIWGDAARGADGSTAYAINQARKMLMDAPVTDDLGAQAKQAYMAARQAHAQQMSLVDPKLSNGMPNPNFQPLVKSVVMDGKPPEQLFGTGFLNAPPSVAQKNLSFLSQIDPNAPQQIGTTLMGEIKRQALSSASDQRGTVSEAVLRGWANDPVKSARLDALLPQEAANTFRNLSATVEKAKKFPVASAVNTSNSGSAVVNAGMSMLKNSALGQIAKRMPILKGIAEGLDAASNQTAVNSALKPGVTLKDLASATPSQAALTRLATRALVPAASAGVTQSSPQSAQGPQE